MKLEIPKNSKDWNTNTDDPIINTFRELMIENNEYEGEPNIGIFWYDVNKHELFGVYSIPADMVQFQKSNYFDGNIKTFSKMHYAIWKKEQYKKRDRRFLGDYTLTPRGRIFEIEDKGFLVCTGEWINNHPEAKGKILFEFDLPEDKTEFRVDEHWDIGHGWSDKVN